MTKVYVLHLNVEADEPKEFIGVFSSLETITEYIEQKVSESAVYGLDDYEVMEVVLDNPAEDADNAEDEDETED